jgi:DNA-binding CsgD family transcriptional regulator
MFSIARSIDVASPEHHPPLVDCLVAVLDEIDYGALLVSARAEVRHFNRAAKREFDDGCVLRLAHGRVHAPTERDDKALLDAIRAASTRACRTLLTMGPPHAALYLAVVPAASSSPTLIGQVLLLLGRRGICEPLSAAGFARRHGLTHAEAAVLVALAQGHPPLAIARLHGVALTTIRTQIQSIRDKTGTKRLQDIVARIATLPPLLSALRA